MAFLPFSKDFPLSPSEFQNEIDRLFQRFWHGGISTGPLDGQDWAPPVDVLEEEDRFVVRAEVPGLESRDIEVSVSGDRLTLKGHKPTERREDDERNYLRSERRFGGFQRIIELPMSVDPEDVTAGCRKGVLEVVLVKKDENRPKAIRVDVSD